MTAPARHRAGIESVAVRLRCRVTVVGTVEQGAAPAVDRAGRPLAALGTGFHPLKQRR